MFKSTVDSVISDISVKIGQLRDLAEQHEATAFEHHNKSYQHKDQAEVHLSFRDRATRIASKFEELLK